MREIKEYAYPYQEDNSEMMTAILNSTAPVPDSYLERSENCHISKGVEESRARAASGRCLGRGSCDHFTLWTIALPLGGARVAGWLLWCVYPYIYGR